MEESIKFANTTDKLIIRNKTIKRNPNAKCVVVKVSLEAMDAICELQSKTNLSAKELSSMMILWAAERTEIKIP